MTTIKNRRGTAAEWTSANPILAAGEKGVELDTGKFKVGNGSLQWSTLPYFVSETVIDSKDAALTSAINANTSAINLKSPINSPTFTGNPTVPTPAFGDADFSIANTAWAAERKTIGNLLTSNQASIETDTTGFQVTALCTISRITTAAAHGSACLAITSTGAGQARASAWVAGVMPWVVPGQVYTLTFAAKAPSITSSLVVQYVWRDSVGAPITFADVEAKNLKTSWQTWSATLVAPAGAAQVEVRPAWTAVSAGEVVHADEFGLWAGAGGDWAMPGVPITNQGTRITRPNNDDRLIEQWNPNKVGGAGWSVVDYDSGCRDWLNGATTGTIGLRNWRFGVNGAGRSTLHIQRKNNRVTVRAWELYPPAGSTTFWGATSPRDGGIFEIPTGFRSVSASGWGIVSGLAVWNQYNYSLENVLASIIPIYGNASLEGWASPNVLTVTTAPPGTVTANWQLSFEVSWNVGYGEPIPTSLPGTVFSPAPA